MAAPPDPLDQTKLVTELGPWCEGPGSAAYPQLAKTVQALTSLSVFLTLLVRPVPKKMPGRPTKPTKAVADSVVLGLFQRPRRRMLRAPAHAFPRLKSIGIETRMVMDSEINDAMGEPAPCWLPMLHAITEECGRWQFGATLDMVGWFSQFTLALAVAAPIL